MNSVDQFKTLKNPTIQIIGPCAFDQNLIKELNTIFVDGGLEHYDNQKLLTKNKISVGDGDSNKSSQTIDIPFDTNKAFSDLSGAFHILSDDCIKLYALGFLGARKDHELSNLMELNTLCLQRRDFSVHLEDKIQILSPGRHSLIVKGSFSLFAFLPNRVNVTGLIKYPLHQEELRPLSSHGLSNIGSGLINFEIEGAPLLVFIN